MTQVPGEFEVERKWLLRCLPDRVLKGPTPPGMTRCRIRQGYLCAVSPEDPRWDAARSAAPGETPTVGRIRASERDGASTFIHTLKHGSGLVRHEFERPVTEAAFEAAWPFTVGRRLEKTRWRFVEGGVCWEIDRIDRPEVVLVEAEAPSVEAATSLHIPSWLAEVVDREVTDEPQFTNAEMAFRSGFQGQGTEGEGSVGGSR